MKDTNILKVARSFLSSKIDDIYDFLGIIIIPSAAISVSLFTEFFKKELSISRATITLIMFLFVVIISFFIFSNRKIKTKLENEHSYALKLKDNEISNLSRKNDQLEYDLRDQTKGLWKEFGHINKFKKMEYLFDLLKQFAELHPSIVGIQFYSYYLQRDADNTSIKLNHELSYIMENKNMNALQQQYYNMPSELHKKFLDGSYQYRGTAEDNDKKLIDLYFEIGEGLEEIKEPKDIRSNHIINFGLQILILDMLGEKDTENKQKVALVENDELETELFKSSRRTGILRGILYDKMFYQFSYSKQSFTGLDKVERIYLTIKMKSIIGKQGIMVITLDDQGKSNT